MVVEEKRLKKYPHLGKIESAVWQRFLAKYPAQYTSYTYDVRVGRGAKVKEETGEVMKKMYIRLTRKRIDVVGKKGRNVGIFEVRPRATIGVIGELFAYVQLWKKDNPGFWATQGILVTERADEDTIASAKWNRVRVFIV